MITLVREKRRVPKCSNSVRHRCLFAIAVVVSGVVVVVSLSFLLSLQYFGMVKITNTYSSFALFVCLEQHKQLSCMHTLIQSKVNSNQGGPDSKNRTVECSAT